MPVCTPGAFMMRSILEILQLGSSRNDVPSIGFNAKYLMTKSQYQALKEREQKEKRKAKLAAAVTAAKEAKLKRSQEDKRKSGK